ESATALPGFVAGVLTVALAGWIVSLLVRRRFDVFDSMFLLSVAAGLCALTIQRVSIDSEAATRLRYGYMVTVLLAVPLVRHLRLPRSLLVRGAFCVVALGVLVANVDSLNEAIDVREQAGQEARGLTVAASSMVHDGEPLVEGPSELSHGLELDEFLDLVEEGYDPAPLPEDRGDRDEIEAAARGALRMNLVDRRRPRERYVPEAGTPPTTTEAPVDDEGCVVLAEGEPVTFEVTGAAGLTFDKRRAQSLTLRWVDQYGEGIRHFDDVDVREAAVGLAEPETTAELTMTSPLDELTVCGVAEG
ncbi:MAG TPA: hypothetical protein VD926_08665, partial [Acidimicrobiales bacterium]|nr:hypothetical protein [Acidimicrobiales bacterium]